MFPHLIKNASSAPFPWALATGRDKWAYILAALFVLAGTVLVIAGIAGPTLPIVGTILGIGGFLISFLLLFLVNKFPSWGKITSIEIRPDGTMKVNGTLFGRKLKERTMPLTYLEKRKEGYYLGSSYYRSVFLPFGGFGHDEADFLDRLAKMIEAKNYPLKG